jgi:phosphatidylglycerophosphatase C
VLYARLVDLRTADEVWARVEAVARAEAGGVVATDGDGTLWSGDVGEDLFHAFLEHGRVEEPAKDAMRREARGHGLSDAGSGPEVARRIYDAYLEGRFPEERICELMTWCFAGWRRDEGVAFARKVVQDAKVEGRLHAEVLGVVERARAAGIRVVLVSASPVVVIREAGALVGFGETDVVAALPRFDDAVMFADVERPIPYAGGKVTRLRERIGAARTLYAAFGDNVFDLALLSSARVGVAVRPKPRLRARANEVDGLVELLPEGVPAGVGRGRAG